jgi:hypothetical protein
MSFLSAGSWRRLVLAKRERHRANKNQIAIFVFGVTAKDFPHGVLVREKEGVPFREGYTRKIGVRDTR